ncbi:MAG: hypothetical protein Q8K63_12280 [Acidimicrobiales bacterium]|nr:hypothetical protein [Acidimicrobiales bacterium]
MSQEDWESAAQAMQSAQRTRLEMRLDILDVLANALGRLDEINRVIRDSTDRNAARIALTTEPFGYSEISVDHLLDMTLARQTARARSDLENERAVIRAELDG